MVHVHELLAFQLQVDEPPFGECHGNNVASKIHQWTLKSADEGLRRKDICIIVKYLSQDFINYIGKTVT